MSYSTIIFTRKDGYAVITLNRPDKLNALNNQMFHDLEDAIGSIQLDSSIKALILTGSGDKAFAAGADIKELHESDELSGKIFSGYGSYVMRRLSLLQKPTIAAVNGFALGGGCELAMACHMRFASEKAKFSQPEVNLGIIPGYGATQRLPRLVGAARAFELILSANMIGAAEAERIGLVNRVYPPDQLMDETEKFVKLILSKGPIAVQAAIKCINASMYMSPMEGLEYESNIFGEVCGTEDFKEGTKAFLEKRQPEFRDK